MKLQTTSPLLINEHSLQVLPSLACLVGLERAIILQQIHFTLRMPKSGRNIGGHHWIYNTAKDWQRDHFPWWSESSIRKHLTALEKDGYVISAQFDKAHWDHKKYYRINYELLNQRLAELPEPHDEEDIPDRSGIDSESDESLLPDRAGNASQIDAEDSATSLTETSSETSSETPAATTPAPEPKPERPADDAAIALQVRKELTSAGVQHGERLDEVVKRLSTRPDGALIARLIAQGTALRAEREMLCGRPLANPAGLVIKTCLSYPLDEPLQTEVGIEAALDTERKALERAKNAKQHSGKSFRRGQVSDSTDAERAAANKKAGKELQANIAKLLATAQERLRDAQERLDKEHDSVKRRYWQDMIAHVNAEIKQMQVGGA